MSASVTNEQDSFGAQNLRIKFAYYSVARYSKTITHISSYRELCAAYKTTIRCIALYV